MGYVAGFELAGTEALLEKLVPESRSYYLGQKEAIVFRTRAAAERELAKNKIKNGYTRPYSYETDNPKHAEEFKCLGEWKDFTPKELETVWTKRNK